MQSKVMYKVTDNFLPNNIFNDLQNYCYNNDFSIIDIGNKELCVLETPKEIIPYLEIDGQEIVLSFIRKAYNGFDEDHRIHADGIINGQQTSVATVLYINSQKNVTTNGTSFWIHKTHGVRFKSNEKEFNRLLTEDANDLSKWELKESVNAVENRMLQYDTNLFHNKFPSKIEKGERIVLVTFYKKKINLHYRQLAENDYDNFLVKWWQDNRFAPPRIDFLPNNGKDGIVVIDTDTNQKICAGFLYITNSEVAWLEFIVSNFEVKDKELRKQAIEFLIKQLIKTSGKKYIFTTLKSPNLIKHFTNSGFVIGSENTTELICITK